jgi:hypothetical protein
MHAGWRRVGSRRSPDVLKPQVIARQRLRSFTLAAIVALKYPVTGPGYASAA